MASQEEIVFSAGGRISSSRKPSTISAVVPINQISFFENVRFLASFPEIVNIVIANNTNRKLESFSEKVLIIDVPKFDHGATRNLCSKFAKGDILLFMTQDAIAYDDYFAKEIIDSFRNDDAIKAVYGKHICPMYSDIFERFERNYVYPDIPRIQSFKTQMKFEDVFVSNTCFCVLKDVFWEVGGFPSNIICSEELVLSLKILQRGYLIMYNPKVRVVHCHNEDMRRTFGRWFDIGVFFSDYKFIYELMKVKSYGKALILSEVRYFSRKPYVLPKLIVRAAIRYLALELGLYSRFIPDSLKKRISLNKYFWDKS